MAKRQWIASVLWGKKPRDNQSALQEAIQEIETVYQLLENATNRFEMERDPDLIESCIYEMEALSARYRFLIREAKERGLTCDPLQRRQYKIPKEGRQVG